MINISTKENFTKYLQGTQQNNQGTERMKSVITWRCIHTLLLYESYNGSNSLEVASKFLTCQGSLTFIFCRSILYSIHQAPTGDGFS
jgi:hypothetical protein